MWLSRVLQPSRGGASAARSAALADTLRTRVRIAVQPENTKTAVATAVATAVTEAPSVHGGFTPPPAGGLGAPLGLGRWSWCGVTDRAPGAPPSAFANRYLTTATIAEGETAAADGDGGTSESAPPGAGAAAAAATASPDRPLFAVVAFGGKQYKVSQADRLTVNRVRAPVGSKIVLHKVLLAGCSDWTMIGTPLITEGVTVTATVAEHFRGAKVQVFKKKRRKGYAKRRGHRQEHTVLQIDAIDADVD